MLGNLHVRFGGGRTEKEPKGHLAGRLPYPHEPPAGRNPSGRESAPRAGDDST